MSTFSSQRGAVRQPLRTLVLPPTIWATAWEKRPDDDVCTGLRLIADEEIAQCRGDAATYAWRMHADERQLDERIECYNDMLIREICLRVTCDPNDIAKPFFRYGITSVRDHITSAGARVVFQAYERFVVEVSPLHREANDDDLADLVEHLSNLSTLSPSTGARVRRYLQFALEDIQAELT